MAKRFIGNGARRKVSGFHKARGLVVERFAHDGFWVCCWVLTGLGFRGIEWLKGLEFRGLGV